MKFFKTLIICLVLSAISTTIKSQWLTNGNSIATSRCSDYKLGTLTACPLRLFTDDTLRMLITPTGNVGIGIENPQNFVHIHNKQNKPLQEQNNGGAGITTGPTEKGNVDYATSYSESSILLTNYYSGNAATDGLKIQSNNYSAIFHLQEDGLMQFKTTKPTVLNFETNGDIGIKNTVNITTIFVAKSDGKIGIGTSLPTEKLHLQNGNAKIEGNVFVTQKIGIGTTNPTQKLQVSGGNALFEENIFVMQKIGIGTNTPGEKLHLQNGNAKIEGNGYFSGNLGVGTDAPTNKLHVAGDGYVSGNVGIGASPSSGFKLWVSGNTYVGQKFGVQCNNPKEAVQIGSEFVFHNGGTKYFGRNIYFDGTNDKKIVNGYSSAICFDASGNIALRVYANGSSGAAVEQTGKLALYNNGNIEITGSVDVNGHCKITKWGQIWARQCKINIINPWPDFVFNDEHKKPTLSELEEYINTNKHLPDIPTEKEVKANGLDLEEICLKLLQKIEELTLYTIEQNKRINDLEQQLNKNK